MSKVFFVSDTHFGHDNIIKYSNRPFDNVHDMNHALIMNWNARVGKNDTVYHIGDFAFGKGKYKTQDYFNKLNGVKHLIIGNHDGHRTIDLPWKSVNSLLEIKVDKQRIILCHYSMRVWHHSYQGTWQLYGHSHGSLPEQNVLSCDVGVDVWNYTPVSFKELKRKMLWKKDNPEPHLFRHQPSKEIRSNEDMEKCRQEIFNLNLQFLGD